MTSSVEKGRAKSITTGIKHQSNDIVCDLLLLFLKETALKPKKNKKK